METNERLDPPWLKDASLRRLFAVLEAGGGEARVIGGAVRNTLMGEPIKDVDVGTTLVPESVVDLARKAGLHAVPTGIAHGTVTVVVDSHPIEVTTLRRDVATFGRHAEVAFTTDWSEDAHRRDLTVNALSLTPDGRVFDYVGGIADCRAHRIRFIGDPAERMREDYLRILRFFRIHATYGRGEIDPDGLTAAAANKAGLAQLSAERIQAELFMLLLAPGVLSVAPAMVSAGIFAEVLPGEASASRLARALAAEAEIGAVLGAVSADPAAWPGPAPEIRLAALAGCRSADAARAVATRLKLSRAATDRMAAAVSAAEAVPVEGAQAARAATFRRSLRAVLDGMVLASAANGWSPEFEAAIAAAAAFAAHGKKLPVTARLLIDHGLARPGPTLGTLMADLEAHWIETDFAATREDLLALAARRVANTGN